MRLLAQSDAYQRGAPCVQGRGCLRSQPNRRLLVRWAVQPKEFDPVAEVWDDGGVYFEILGEVSAIETIATGSGIRELARLRKRYGRGRWRKRKGVARVRLQGGEIVLAEVHWYEATGIGKREFKIKYIL